MSSDRFKAVREAASARSKEIAERYLPGGHWEGPEYIVRNPSRADSKEGSLKFNTAKGVWKDFASDQKGDVIDWVVLAKGCSKLEALKELESFLGIVKPDSSRDLAPKPKGLPFPPDGAPEPDEASLSHFHDGKPAAVWTYRKPTGEPAFLVARWNRPDGGKEVRPYSWTTANRWQWIAPGEKDRPLYNLDQLTVLKKRPVLIVEGEKTAEAAQKLTGIFGVYVVTTWQGGSKALPKTDWKPLEGRPVTIWPDNDKAGREAATWIKAKFPGARIVQVGKLNLPDKWDLADPLPEGLDVIRALEDASAILEDVKQDAEPSHPFLPLGISGAHYFYWRTDNGRLISISAAGHSKTTLIDLANLDHWESLGIRNDKGIDWFRICNWLIHIQNALPPFSLSRVFGAGVWHHDGHTVVNTGRGLFIDGRAAALTDGATRSRVYIPRSRSFAYDPAHPGAIPDFLPELYELLPWQHPGMAWRLGGFLVYAVAPGYFEHRPNIWLLGESDTGKTWTISNVISPLLGDMKLAASGLSSPAGMSQAIGHDSLLALLDEMDAENKDARFRLDGHMENVRSATSDNEGAIYKGTQDGIGLSRSLRCCFLWASVRSSAVQQADRNRFLEIETVRRKDPRLEKFKRLQELAGRLTPEVCFAYRMAVIKRLPQLQEAARAFNAAMLASGAVRDSRARRNEAAVAAGWWMLTHETAPTKLEAAQWVLDHEADFEPPGERSELDPGRDYVDCLNHVLTIPIRADGPFKTRHVGELLEDLLLGQGDAVKYEADAHAALSQLGVAVKPHRDSGEAGFVIASNHPGLKSALNGSYDRNWHQQLRRYPGANDWGRTNCRFGGITTKVVWLPKSAVCEV